VVSPPGAARPRPASPTARGPAAATARVRAPARTPPADARPADGKPPGVSPGSTPSTTLPFDDDRNTATGGAGPSRRTPTKAPFVTDFGN
jgi:hypothetical protein